MKLQNGVDAIAVSCATRQAEALNFVARLNQILLGLHATRNTLRITQPHLFVTMDPALRQGIHTIAQLQDRTLKLSLIQALANFHLLAIKHGIFPVTLDPQHINGPREGTHTLEYHIRRRKMESLPGPLYMEDHFEEKQRSTVRGQNEKFKAIGTPFGRNLLRATWKGVLSL